MVTGYSAWMKEIRNANRILVGKTLRRLKKRCEENIKMDVKEIDCENVNCIELTKDHFQRQALVLAC
jgi:hypothetical protein